MSKFQSAAQIRDEFRDFLLRMAAYFEPYPELRSAGSDLRVLAESLSKPFTLAVFGYMKTGKSSLINAMIGRPLAPIGTDETTATLNRISYGDATQEVSIIVHWRDGRPPEPIPFSRVEDWTGKSVETLARVRETSHLQFFANASSLKDVEIVDTPGIGSVASDHTMVASEVLSGEEGKKADALLYVFPAVAKALDAETLDEFRKTRLPGSDPYNSIGVLHKWDGLEADDLAAEVGKKARELGQKLSDVLCKVIPVSAPLALVARHAPASFLEGLLELTTLPGNHDLLKNSLEGDMFWDADATRKRARIAYDLPWVSFVRVVRLLMEHSCASPAAAKAVCLEASGIERLETELDRRFYMNAAIIKQLITRVKALEPVKKGILFFNERIDLLRDDHRHFVELESQAPTGGKHGPWLKQKSSDTERELRTLEEHAIRANRDQLAEEERMNLMERDLDFLKRMTDDPGLVDAADQDCIRRLLASSHDSGDSQANPRKALEALVANYQHEMQGPTRKKRQLFEHLIRRVSENLS